MCVFFLFSAHPLSYPVVSHMSCYKEHRGPKRRGYNDGAINLGRTQFSHGAARSNSTFS